VADSKNSNKKYEILAGHEKIGSKFTLFPNSLTETRYAEVVLPELIWIAVLNHELGEQRTARIVACIAKCVNTGAEDTEQWFVLARHLARLSVAEISCVKKSLTSEGLLTEIQKGLSPFLFLYPDFPVQWLNVHPVDRAQYLNQFKELLGFLIDKRSRQSTLMLACATYGLLVSGQIIIPDKSLVEDMNSLQDYPHSDQSRKAASSIRALTNSLAIEGESELTKPSWSGQFWQRGLVLEPPDFSVLLRGESK